MNEEVPKTKAGIDHVERGKGWEMEIGSAVGANVRADSFKVYVRKAANNVR
jgi:hypothetical protein